MVNCKWLIKGSQFTIHKLQLTIKYSTFNIKIIMKKFAFISTNWLQKCYKFVLNKQRSHKHFVDSIKIWWLFAFIIMSWIFYLRFVSLASTEWYFLRQANNELNETSFKHEIVKTKILDQTQKNWEQMYWNNQSKNIIDIRPEIVRIPSKTELTINK